MLHSLTKLIFLTDIVRADIQYIHWKAAGVDFEKIHDLTERLYTYLFRIHDIIAEITRELKLPVFNPSDWYKYVSDYETENEDSYSDFSQTVLVIQTKVNLVIDELQVARKVLDDEDVKSQLDEFTRDLKKECNYKLDQILNVPKNTSINFIMTGLDNRVANY